VQPVEQVADPPQGHWTYADYVALPDDGHRYEVVDGVLYVAPTPTIAHQSASNLFATYLTIHIQFAGKGRVFAAPCDVELAAGVITQPDIAVVLNDNTDIITPMHLIGAANLIVEIASSSTVGYDRREKQDAYARAGVAEYWIADPATRTVELLMSDQGSYRSLGVFQGQATLPSRTIPGLPIRVEQFFV
jgi:Uma2 family endonuclease